MVSIIYNILNKLLVVLIGKKGVFMDAIKKYSNGELTIVWQPKMCSHSANCVKGLSKVFDSKAKPWINAEGASTEEIKAQVNKCPSGALSFFMNDV